MMVFEQDGQFIQSWGKAQFTRPHGVTIDKDGILYCVDDDGHWIGRFSSDGELLSSIGRRNQGAVAQSGDPFNRPTNHRLQIFDAQGNYLNQWNNLHRPCGLHISDDLVYIGQLLPQYPFNEDYPNIGACITIHDLSGRRVARLGDSRSGEAPGQFIAPHGLAVDSRGDIYVGEVSWTAYGQSLSPPRKPRSFRKLVKK